MTEYVYLLRSSTGLVKIGRSDNPQRRIRDLSYDDFYRGQTFTVQHTIESSRAEWLEDCLHKAFWHRRHEREMFALSDKDLGLLKTLTRCDSLGDLPKWATRLMRANILRHRASRNGKPRSRRALIAARVLLGISCRELAERVGLGWGTMEAIERGGHHTTPERWARIAETLGEPAEKLAKIFRPMP